MSEASYQRYVLGQLRMARLRARLLMTEIDTIGKAVKAGWIAPEDALAWFSDALALVQCQPHEEINWEVESAAKDQQ